MLRTKKLFKDIPCSRLERMPGEKDGWIWDGAYITELPERAQTRQKQIRQMIEALAVHPDPLPTTEEPLPLIFRESPQEFQIMVQELAQDYYTFYQKQIDKPYARGLAPITSTHNIAVPSSTEMRGLMQSHTPGMQIYKQESLMSLMESDDGSESEIHLITPNNAQLRTKGDNKQEQEVLDAYIRKEKGIEGLKAMLVLISAYHDQTGGRDRKEDACVKIRDLIKRVHNNDESHADDPDEQRKFMHAFLFFARTYVTDMSKPAERSRKKQGQKLREYTPLVILEGLKADESTGIVVPKEVEYHLGKDFYDLMFGSRKQYYILPTSLILDLHSKNDQHEFCLTLYLANLINLNKGNFAIHFPEMLLQSGLETKEEIKHGHDRTRDALPAIYALEWMERVAIIKRHPHDDIDTILAIEHFRQNGTCLTETYDEYQARLIGNKMQKKLLSSETYRRVITQYYYLQGKSATELQNTRRKKLKHLLDTHDNNSIIFNAGAIIHKQAEKYRQQHLAAIELNEKAKIAAMARSKKQGKKPMQKG